MSTPEKIQAPVDKRNDQSTTDFSDTIANYRQMVESQPLRYVMTGKAQMAGVALRTYRMTSQSWSPAQLVSSSEWQHNVTIYVPDNALPNTALLVVNNGSRYDKNGSGPIEATDFSSEMLAAIARDTKTVVVSVDNVPNQPLSYTDDGKVRSGDGSIAHSWKLSMEAPEQRATIPLHVPMAASVSRAMTLAERETASLGIKRFVVSGISKRAWAAWLAAVADPRISAVVPFALDLLNTREALRHTYDAYGGNWPIAFYPYYAENIDRNIDTPEFAQLMEIEDPLSYLNTRYAKRLGIEKYIVNASGDDFFVPDNSNVYYNKLPGKKALRNVPNSGHLDIRESAKISLTASLNRFQRGAPLPEVNASLDGLGVNRRISFSTSERPQKLLLWSATNPDARDFRYACNIRYTSTPIDTNTSQVSVSQPESGWSAYFVEATFADGFVATSEVYVLGKNGYPVTAPPNHGKTCSTLPGRGLRP